MYRLSHVKSRVYIFAYMSRETNNKRTHKHRIYKKQSYKLDRKDTFNASTQNMSLLRAI